MNVNRLIDHTLLNPDATEQQIINLCKEAIQYNFKSVCVNPSWVKIASKELLGSAIEVCTVVGFPLGANKTEVKLYETAAAIQDGATEIDMVLNIAQLKQGNVEYVKKEINAVVEASQGKLVKVIIETALLLPSEIELASKVISESNAKFVKTSTGFSKSGAKLEDVKIIKAAIDEHTEIKASGGIKSIDQLIQFYDEGVTRIGTSNGIAIVEGQKVSAGY
ncbi:MAG: deoxyribose-phosphate aldolase [Solibacillus sp.]